MENNIERTFVIIKPDGIQRRLVGEIIKRLENRELWVIKIKSIRLDKEICEELYKDSIKKFPRIKEAIIDYMTDGSVIIMIVEGEDAIKKAREVRGFSDPSKSPIGSVRRDLAGDQDMEELTRLGRATKNILHASGNKEEVEFEIKLFFKEDEI